MKKVAFLINGLSAGGAEKVLLTILEAMLNDGYTVELICIEKNNFYKLPQNLQVTYLYETDKYLTNIQKVFYTFYMAYILKQYVQNHRINVIQSHLYRANYINILAKILGSKHIVQVVNHGIVSQYKKKGFLGWLNFLFIKFLYGRADCKIFVSEIMKKNFNLFFKTTNPSIVINNLYDLNKINILKSETVTNFNFEDNKNYLVVMGRLINLKRYEDVIISLSNLDKHIELIILGDGEKKDELISLSQELGVDKRTHFLGNVKNPYKYLAKADIFILSSESEGFPNSIIEAMNCGLPIIASDCVSGPREILSPKSDLTVQLKNKIELAEFGILYSTANIENLIESIDIMTNDKNLKKTYIQKGYTRASDFSVETILPIYKRVLYEEC